MINTILIWAICSAVVFAALVYGRRSILHRRVKVVDLDWKAVAVISMLAGALPAFLYDQARSRNVEVPPAVDDRAAVRGPEAP
ncbi:MAG: hypothetical protein O2905_03225 [Proteobacteria bacterium]|nr:hypothetical protein [Pseudomonadota bacterium]